MKICIYGAGAIGGWVGGLLARAGADVTLIARGAHLAAMRENGLKVVSEAESFTTRPAPVFGWGCGSKVMMSIAGSS